VCERVEGWVCG
jgi:hypothetical protein